MNLLEETVSELNRQGKSVEDVKLVFDGKASCTWQDFAVVAEDYNYNNGYGLTEVNEDLKIVGDDWWLERGEYDGSEWWVYKTFPKCPEPSSNECWIRSQ